MKANTVKVYGEETHPLTNMHVWFDGSNELWFDLNADVRWLNLWPIERYCDLEIDDAGKIIGDRDENQTPTKMWV